MWDDIDEGIRSRIIKNIENVYMVKSVFYILLLAVVSGVMFATFNMSFAETGMPPLAVALCIAFVGLGLIAVLYIYFTNVREKSAIINDAIYMTVGKVVSKSDNNHILVKLPGEKSNFKIECNTEMYEKAAVDVRVLVVSASKKNTNQMYGVDPSSYDIDGIL